MATGNRYLMCFKCVMIEKIDSNQENYFISWRTFEPLIVLSVQITIRNPKKIANDVCPNLFVFFVFVFQFEQFGRKWIWCQAFAIFSIQDSSDWLIECVPIHYHDEWVHWFLNLAKETLWHSYRFKETLFISSCGYL